MQIATDEAYVHIWIPFAQTSSCLRVRPSTLIQAPRASSAAEATSDTEYFDRPSPDGSGGAGRGWYLSHQSQALHPVAGIREAKDGGASAGVEYGVADGILSTVCGIANADPGSLPFVMCSCCLSLAANAGLTLAVVSANGSDRSRVAGPGERLLQSICKLCLTLQKSERKVERSGQGHCSLWCDCKEERAGCWQKERRIRMQHYIACGDRGDARRGGRGGDRAADATSGATGGGLVAEDAVRMQLIPTLGL